MRSRWRQLSAQDTAPLLPASSASRREIHAAPPHHARVVPGGWRPPDVDETTEIVPQVGTFPCRPRYTA
jgi:hypothetical protein